MGAQRSTAALLWAGLLVCLAATAGAQESTGDLDDYLNRRALDCSDITLNAIMHIPRLIEEDKPDSTRILLDFWKGSCRMGGFILRTDILVRIWDDSFSERLYEDQLLWTLLGFRNYMGLLRQEDVQREHLWSSWESSGVAAWELAEYDEILFNIAEQLVPYTEDGTIENLLARTYAGQVDDVFVELRQPAYRGTLLHKDFEDTINRLAVPSYGFLSGYGGSWHPTGPLSRVGPKGVVGFMLGYRQGRLHARIPVEFGFGGLKEGYQLNHDGELIDAETYNQVYVGLEPAWSVVDNRNLRVDLIAGTGWAGARWNDPDDPDEAEYLNAWRTSLGVGVNLPIGRLKDGSVGLEVLRSWLPFDTGAGGTDISGGDWSLRLVFSWTELNTNGKQLAEFGLDRWQVRP